MPDQAIAVAAGVPPISFSAHENRSGSAGGARDNFETMIAQLAAAIRPGVRRIAAHPGDWGIDAFVGDLGGAIAVWQSKYFYPVTKATHKRTIQDSFDSALAAAKTHGYTVEMWVLCIPSSMDGPTAKWWDGWKPKQERDYGLVIELWDETALRTALHSPEGDSVRRAYYEPFTPVPQQGQGHEQLRLVLDVEEEKGAELEAALFVRQMTAAGHVELDSAKRQFFNADLVAREIAHKAVPAETAALSSADATLHGLWEMQFNDCTAEGVLGSLHSRVWRDVRTEHERLPKILRLEVVHAWGLVHRLVDNRKAGWVKHWREIAATHQDI
ncbi:serine/threonine protein kinase [Kitasatospora sp. MBT63]|uniref:serine/threonine protein kinase n=1 Tax=Kitasatospora sp. MBT63 TaxID=1444768 RepID=UPI001E514B40|nr:serine/threonine protein kinase [Kitasatospora sp. MBT63]